MNPNDPYILIKYGGWLWTFGRAQEGVEMINRAYRLNPHYPVHYDTYVDPFYATGQYDEVITRIHRARGDPIIWNDMLVAMSYAELGRQTDAAAVVTEMLRHNPDFSFERMLSEYAGIKDQATLAHYLEGVHKAGLRDCASNAELQKYPKMTHLTACDTKRATN